MMNPYSIEKIKQMKKKFSINCNDTTLLNSLAIAYLMNTEANGYNKVDDLLRQAYTINPSVKTANNYAYQLICDNFEYQKGIDILQPFVDLKPRSYMPYNLLGFAYLKSKRYEQANKYLRIAMELSNNKNLSICNNLAVSLSLNNLNEEAYQLYTNILYKEPITETMYNKAIASVELGSSDISSLIEQIHKSTSYMSSIDNIDLSVLYYLINDYHSSYKCLIENCNFSLLEWKSLSFVLYHNNRRKFEEIKQDAICQRELWKKDFYGNVDYDDCSENEIDSLNNDIQELDKLECHLMCPPVVNTKELYHTLPIGCMLFDCKVCNNPFDD